MRRLGLAALALLAAPAAAQEAAAPERPRVGLVLSGGGARGAAHVGVLQVLEELQVPVDVVVGTSMGSIVGGLYAAGYSPDEMQAVFEEADWETILSDAPPRDTLWFRRRQDDRRFQIDLELGWRDGAPVLPPGLILGLNVDAFLDHLLYDAGAGEDFDALRIPFRCVATDLADGSAYVFDRGSLTKAIRASMSLPGVFAPVPHEGRALVDGGVVDNVPVDVARALGAEIVIVVDISTPLGDADETPSLLGVSNRVVDLLMVANRNASMASLTDDDVAIVPDLGTISTMDFRRTVEAIDLGRASADGARERLAALAAGDDAWGAYLERQRRTPLDPPTVRSVRVEGDTGFSDEVVRRVAQVEAGDVVDGDELELVRERIAGLGVFQKVDVVVERDAEDPAVADLVLRPVEKGWGPHYLRFRVGASSDLQGSGDFDLGVQHTWTPANRYGGEWRNEVQLGTFTRLYSEWYQPLDPGLRWFLAPNIEYEQDDVPLFLAGEKFAEFDIAAFDAGLALGRNLGDWGEARVGYGYSYGRAEPEVAFPGLFPSSTTVEGGQLTTTLAVDTLDNVVFPRRGLVGRANWEFTNDAFGGDEETSLLAARVQAPLTIGAVTISPSLEGGSTFDGETAFIGEFFLGGFQRLSGLELRELSGNHYALAVLEAYWQLDERTTRYSSATYVGASIELGNAWIDRDDVAADDLILAGSGYVALDSILGPLYLGVGLAEGGNVSAYMFLEPVFGDFR